MKTLRDTYIFLLVNLMSLRMALVPYLVVAVVLPLGFTYLVSLAVRDVMPPEAALNMLIGVVVLSISLSVVNGVGQGLGQDRLMKRLELIASYPVSPASYIMGVSLVFLLSSVANTVVTVVAGGAAWGMLSRVVAVLPQLVLLSLAASLGLIGIGAIIGTRASNLPQIYALTNIASFAVAMLTPAYYPIEAMPAILRPISLALPTTHAALLARNLLGIGSYDTARHLALLLALSTAYLILGFRGIKWREE